MKVTKPVVASGECSGDTIRRRSKEMSKIRDILSMGSSGAQMGDEIKMLPKEVREALMKEANFTITIPPEAGLAMKVSLNIPWNKLRLMRRYRAHDTKKYFIILLLHVDGLSHRVLRWLVKGSNEIQ